MGVGRQRTVGRFVCALLLAVGAGCSGDDLPLADVTGVVTFNGKPSTAEIIFEPRDSGRPSSAFTEADGSFRLQYSSERAGAVVGTHQVTLKIMRPNPTAEPQTFTQAVTPVKVTRLVRDVGEGKNYLQFSISY